MNKRSAVLIAGCIRHRTLLACAMVLPLIVPPRPLCAQTVTSEEVGPDRWDFLLRFAETGSNSPAFALDITDVSDVSNVRVILDSIGTQLSFSRQRTRGGFTATGRLSANLYRNLREADNLSYGGAVYGYYQTSPRTSLTFGQDVSSGGIEETLSAQGVQTIVPDVRVSASLTRAGLVHELTPRTTIAIDYGLDWLYYDSLGAITGSLFLLDPSLNTGDLITAPSTPTDPRLEGPSPIVPDSQLYGTSIVALEGLVVPDTEQWYTDGSATFQHQVSDKTSAFARFTYGWRWFDYPASQDPESQDLYTDGAEIEVTGAVDRRLGPNDGMNLTYDFRQSSSQTPRVTTHLVSGSWDHQMARPSLTLALNLGGGIGYFKVPEQTLGDQDLYYIADGSLEAQIKRSTAIGGRYRRTISRTLGFGRNFIYDDVGANLTQTVGSKLDLAASFDYLRSQELLESNVRYRTQRYDVTVTYRLTTEFSLGSGLAHNRYRQSDLTTTTDFIENVWHFFVQYGRSWPRGLQTPTPEQ